MQQCVQISTRINSTSVHTYILHLFYIVSSIRMFILIDPIFNILDRLDSLYGVSMTFQSLNAALCGLQQNPMESAHTYYNHISQITVILRECHGNHYRLGELARMSK